MPPWVQAVILGIVQGLTEFIPISSSGHLVLVPYLAGWEHPGLAFDVALHIGTAAAVMVYFRRELLAMARGIVLWRSDPDSVIYRRLGLFVVLGSVPVAVAGLFLEDLVGDAFEQPLIVAGFLLVTAALLFSGEHRRALRVRAADVPATTTDARPPVWDGSWIGSSAAPPTRELGVLPVGQDDDDPRAATLDTMTVGQAVMVGVLQIAALLPGISRSGATISAGMMGGMSREAATRFSFLLSLPALVGAFVLSLPDLEQTGLYSGVDIAAGVLASFVSGYIAVRFLVRLVARDRLTGFARYCIFLAIVTVIAYQFLGPPSAV